MDKVRFFPLTLLLILLVLHGILRTQSLLAQEIIGKIQILEQPVYVERADQTYNPTLEMDLYNHDLIKTNKSSEVRILLSSGSELILFAGSEISLHRKNVSLFPAKYHIKLKGKVQITTRKTEVAEYHFSTNQARIKVDGAELRINSQPAATHVFMDQGEILLTSKRKKYRVLLSTNSTVNAKDLTALSQEFIHVGGLAVHDDQGKIAVLVDPLVASIERMSSMEVSVKLTKNKKNFAEIRAKETKPNKNAPKLKKARHNPV